MNPLALSRPHREAASQQRWRGPIRTYTYMMAAWVLDFRAEAEGAGLAVQIFFIAAYLFAFILFLIEDRGSTTRVSGMGSFLATGALFMTVGTVSGLVHDQPFYAVFRNAFTVFVFLSAGYATARVVPVVDKGMLRSVLGLLCAIYVVSSMGVLWFLQGGIDFSKVRFQILGSSAIPALGFIALALPLRLSLAEMTTLTVNAGIVFLSVTRTFVLVALAQAAPLLRHLSRQLGPRFVFYAVAVVAALAIGDTLFGAGVLRWVSRLGNDASAGGGDVTFQTRWSEWTFMYDATVSSIDRLLFGNGLAARTVYWNPKEIGGGAEWSIGFGHNQYVSILFIAGMVGGLPLLIDSLFQARRSVRFLFGVVRRGRSDSDVLFLGAWGATIVIGYMVANIFQSSLGARAPSLWYGIGVGLLLGIQALFDPVNAPAQPQPPARRQARRPA